MENGKWKIKRIHYPLSIFNFQFSIHIMISPLAYIHPEAKIGENVEIAPFVFIDKNVVIGDNNKIMAHASILYGSRIGNGNTIFPGAVIGAIPQDLKFRGEDTTAEIGDNNLIRENVTVNRGTAAKGRTMWATTTC